jgi:hypothetical protein
MALTLIHEEDACVAVSRNMATLNWRGRHVFLTYRALEIALHYFFCF